MDKVFMDTNVLIDHLANRGPFNLTAKRLFLLAESGQIQMCISTLSICNIAYIIRKLKPEMNLLQMLENLTILANLTSVDGETIASALKSDFKDFEDAVQHFSAVGEGGITHFITRNPKDFEKSTLPILSPEEYLAGRK